MTHPLIIIGTGLAGYMTAKEWRKIDKTTPLILFTEDSGHFYTKPMLSNAYRMGKNTDQLITATADEMADQLNADIKTHCTVTAIDPINQHIVTQHDEYCYNQVVLACGANPRHLTISGNATDRVFSVNNYDQYRQFRKHLDKSKHITIMGTGLVGCEFANDLRHHGYDVTMVSPDNHLLQRFLPQPIAHHIQTALEDFGVTCHLNATISKLSYENDERINVQTSQDDLIFHTDIVLSATGLIPNTTLAKNAGITCQRSILVNEFLETSINNIYALGDCVSYNHQTKMYVAPILHAARSLGKTLANDKTPLSLPALPIKVKTSVCPLAFLLPNKPNHTNWHYELNQANEGIALCFDDNEHLQGFILWGKATSQQVKWLKLIDTTIPAS